MDLGEKVMDRIKNLLVTNMIWGRTNQSDGFEPHHQAHVHAA